MGIGASAEREGEEDEELQGITANSKELLGMPVDAYELLLIPIDSYRRELLRTTMNQHDFTRINLIVLELLTNV